MKCYNCQYRGEIHNSAHSRCHALGGNAWMVALFKRGQIKFNNELDEPIVKLSPWGIKNNWGNWPTDFDPVWVETCHLYEEKEVVEVIENKER